MTRTILIAGTASHSGKSTIAAGLCRILSRRGESVAPFKGQNMSNNARAVASPDGGWGEIGVSQYVQAKAAGVSPSTDMNPVLLKPRGDGESQLVIQGDPVGHFQAGSYYDDHWKDARRALVDSYERLSDEYDFIVAEGAGSIAEINLQHRDLANIETARIADAGILLVVDIERGGAFASLYGTVELLPEDIRDRLVGGVINKFRGDASLLDSGIKRMEKELGLPILGVVPYGEVELPQEDSVSLPAVGSRGVWGDDDGVKEENVVKVGVPRLPRISNFTDLEPLAREPGVRVEFLPLDSDLGSMDGVVLPGTKNTVDDLLALHDSGFTEELREFSGYVVGICGGYQMLGQRILNAGIESAREDFDEVQGIGLLPVSTEFSTDKRVEEVSRQLEGTGPLAGGDGMVSGYEIHMGSTTVLEDVPGPVGDHSAATGDVLGTYLHGIFENEVPRRNFVRNLFRRKGVKLPESGDDFDSPYKQVADLVETNLDPDRII